MTRAVSIRLPVFSSDNRKSAIQNRKWAGLFAIGVAFTMAGAVAQAQQPTKVPRIGYLAVNSLSDNAARIDAFRQGLRELGYVEGKNIIIEWRSAEGKPDRLPALAAELVSLQVDVLVSYGPTPTRAAKKATTKVPIVMSFDGDPVGSGVVASLARPGGNITGLSSLAPEISGKQLELLKEIVPTLSRVAVLGNSTEPGNAPALKELELAGGHSRYRFNIWTSYVQRTLSPHSNPQPSSGRAQSLYWQVKSCRRTEQRLST